MDKINQMMRTSIYLIFLFFLCFYTNAFAAKRIINLVIKYKRVNFAGKYRRAIAINNQIPGPTLHFKEGDQVTINVYNHLNQVTSLHWHGLLVPWQMDGVEGVSQLPIPPGGVFHYRFTLYQSGTYWYHAHSGIQEQDGLYGAIVIDPLKPPVYKYSKDYVVVLSDWSNDLGDKVFANLKKEGDYYSPRFPLQASLVRFIHDYRKAPTLAQRKRIVDAYFMMQHMRMSIYDISDVAYDAFLMNGHPATHPWLGRVKKGDIVRLRFIGAGASTIFRVKIPGTTMKMVQVDGNDVKPYRIHNFTIAPGETYDVLVTIKKNTPYTIYAESLDTVGAACGALISHPYQSVNCKLVKPFPEPLPVMMHGRNHRQTHRPKTTGTKYQHLTAKVKTNNPNKSLARIIHMDLFGWMDHYIWMINGRPEYKAKPILIEKGKRYRIIFTNNSMMHHPMHIHGHWFILRNGHGAYDPLLHTIDVPPGATVVADIDADASGQWFFHCHHLYHMMAGMARVFRYQSLVDVAMGIAKPAHEIKKGHFLNRPIVRDDITMPIAPSLISHPTGHHEGFHFATFLELGEDPFHNVQQMTFHGLYGVDYNKLELFTNDAEINKGKVEEADIDIFYWRLLDQFWAIKGGVNYFYRPAERGYWQPGMGIEGLIPFFIDMDLRIYYHDGAVKFDTEFMRDTQITNNFFFGLGIRLIFATKTVELDEVGSGLNQIRYIIKPYYRLAPGVSVFSEYEHQQNYGAFKNLQLEAGESASENTITFGFSFLF